MSESNFIWLSALNGFISILGIVWGYYRSKDPFHPSIYLGLMLFFMYCFQPLSLFYGDRLGLESFIPPQKLEYIQGLNFLGIISIFIGIFVGDKKIKYLSYVQRVWDLLPKMRKRIQQAGFLIGLIGVGTFIIKIANVGGLANAYDSAYGGGWHSNGYIRDGFLLAIPGFLWIMVANLQRRLLWKHWILIAIMSSPFFIHGILGARRGPIAIIAISLVMGWYLIHSCRPKLLMIIGGGIALGLLMIFLVTYRGQIYLGSDLNVSQEEIENSYIFQAGSGNEFIYGSGQILDANIRQDYFWGRRYFIATFIRPIPRTIWPSQYQVVSNFLGIYNYGNIAKRGFKFEETLGWSGAPGAYSGIISDAWLEFHWLYIIWLYGIGWFYGMVWRKVVKQGEFWIPIYVLISAFSVYLVAQNFTETIFRALFTGIPTLLCWIYATRNIRKNQRGMQEMRY
jgi:hypothetical protein